MNKTLLAALLLAPAIALTPTSQADACSPPPPNYFFVNSDAELPLMASGQVAVPALIQWYSLPTPSPAQVSVSVIDDNNARHTGTIEIIDLNDPASTPGIFTLQRALIVWRPDGLLSAGVYTAELRIASPNGSGATAMSRITFQISRGAPNRELVQPALDADFFATAIGRDKTCCPVAERSKGFAIGACFDMTSYDVSTPVGGRMECGQKEGDPCRLCFPTAYDPSPTIRASWTPSKDGLDPLLSYHEVAFFNNAPTPLRKVYSYGPGTSVQLFGTGAPGASTCVSITTISLVDDQRIEERRCFEPRQMTPLPADPSIGEGDDRRAECLMPPEPDMGGRLDMGTDMGGEPDMRQDDLDFAPEIGASGDGCVGCATPANEPAGAVWLLGTLLGMLGWRRRHQP
jgi:hypothetical protein